jgi:hypothetical protein
MENKGLTHVALKACQRSRVTYLFLMFFSVMVFINMYNRSTNSWSDARIRTVRNAVAIFPCAMEWRKAQLQGQQGQTNPEADADAEANAIASVCLSNARVEAIGLSLEGITNAARYLTSRDYLRHGDGSEMLQNDLATWETFQRENVNTVPLPFVGFRIEGDALGVIAGLIFFCLLTMLFFSLDREHLNLGLVRQHDREGLRVLEAYQLFTRTAKTAWAQRENRLIALSVFAPVIMHAMITVLAIVQRKGSFILSSQASWRLLLAEPLLLLLNILMARRCWKVMHELAAEWQDAASGDVEDLHAARAKKRA